jgi:hypothetical protein
VRRAAALVARIQDRAAHLKRIVQGAAKTRKTADSFDAYGKGRQKAAAERQTRAAEEAAEAAVTAAAANANIAKATQRMARFTMWAAIGSVGAAVVALCTGIFQRNSASVANKPVLSLSCHQVQLGVGDFQAPQFYYVLRNLNLPSPRLDTVPSVHAPKGANDFVRCYLTSFGSLPLVDVQLTVQMTPTVEASLSTALLPITIKDVGQEKTFQFALVNTTGHPIRLDFPKLDVRDATDLDLHYAPLHLDDDADNLVRSGILQASRENWPSR